MTREEELNNPGGIVHSHDRWVGMTEDQPDPKFVKFLPGYGLRALARNIRSYQREGINTLLGFAIKWAPRKDSNDPTAYAAFLADACEWQPEMPVVFETILFKLVKGVVTRENGRCIYPDAFIQRWIAPNQGTATMPAPSSETPPAPSAVIVNNGPPARFSVPNLMHPSVIKGAAAAMGSYAATLVLGAIQDFLPQVHMTDAKTIAITGICTFICLHIIKDQS